MSAPLAVNDVLQVSIRATLFAQRIISVLHYRVTTAFGGTSAEVELQDILSTISAGSLFTTYQAAVCPEFNFDEFRIQKVKPTRTIHLTQAVSAPGTYAGTCVSSNQAISLYKQSLIADRKGVGRLQLAGAPSEAFSGGSADVAYLTNEAQDLCDAIMAVRGGTIYASGALKPCLPAGGVDTGYDLWDCIPKEVLRTMHRRTLFLGE